MPALCHETSQRSHTLPNGYHPIKNVCLVSNMGANLTIFEVNIDTLDGLMKGSLTPARRNDPMKMTPKGGFAPIYPPFVP